MAAIAVPFEDTEQLLKAIDAFPDAVSMEVIEEDGVKKLVIDGIEIDE